MTCPQQAKQDAWDERVAQWERLRRDRETRRQHEQKQRAVYSIDGRSHYDIQEYCDNPARGY